jgi:hypothetical protein
VAPLEHRLPVELDQGGRRQRRGDGVQRAASAQHGHHVLWRLQPQVVLEEEQPPVGQSSALGLVVMANTTAFYDVHGLFDALRTLPWRTA